MIKFIFVGMLFCLTLMFTSAYLQEEITQSRILKECASRHVIIIKQDRIECHVYSGKDER